MYQAVHTKEARQFRDTFYKVNDNLDRLHREIQRNRSLKSAICEKAAEFNPNPFKELEMKIEMRSPSRYNVEFSTLKKGGAESVRSHNMRDTVDGLSTRKSYAPGATSYDRTAQKEVDEWRCKRIGQSARRLGDRRGHRSGGPQPAYSSTVDALIDRDTYQPKNWSTEKFTSIEDDIHDLRSKLKNYARQLHVKEELLKDELDRLDERPPVYANFESVEARSRKSSKRSHSIRSADRREGLCASREAAAFAKNSGHFETNYDNIGGNPDYYPTGKLGGAPGSEFLTADDYVSANRGSRISPRYSTRSYDWTSSQKRDLDLQTLEYLEQLKLKKYILQAKAELEEKRRRETAKAYLAQKEWDLRHLDRRQKEIHRKAAYVSKKIEPTYSIETKNLSAIKEERVVHNHKLNLLKQKAEEVRGSEAADQIRRTTRPRASHLLEIPVSRFERLIRENLDLKSKIRSAKVALR